MEVIIPIPLEWGLLSEQGTCVQLFHRFKCTWQRERSNFFSWDVYIVVYFYFYYVAKKTLKTFSNIKCMLICDSYANNIKKAYDIKTATTAYAHHAALSREHPS